MSHEDRVQVAKIPKQIDGEVFLFWDFVVKQCFPWLFFLAIWWVGLQTMNEGIGKFLMIWCFLAASFILGKRMGSLILYEYTLLFIRFIITKPKLFLQVRADQSFEPEVYQPELEPKTQKKSAGIMDGFKAYVDTYLNQKKKTPNP